MFNAYSSGYASYTDRYVTINKGNLILPGTKYRITRKFDRFGPMGLAGNEFMISFNADPRKENILIDLNDSMNVKFLSTKELKEFCELTTDFSDAIYFYTPQEKYGMFSNFSKHGITVNDLFYSTVEHYYQASKFEDLAYKERIRKCNSPKIASELGKSKEQKIRPNWNDIKIDVMTQAIRLKFQQNMEIRTTLINTEDKLLIENSPYDNFWGIGRTGEGINYLGTILMRIRKEIKTTT